MPRAAMKPMRLSNWSIAAVMSSLASAASARSCAMRVVGLAGDGEEPLDQLERVARQRAALQRRLFEEAVGDLRDRAAADIGGAGDRHQVGHQRQRRLAVGAGQRGEHALIFVAAGSGRQRQPLEILLQADLAVEILDQPPPPDRVEIERIDQRVEQRDVAGADFDIGRGRTPRSPRAPAPASRRRRRRDPGRPKDSMPACRNSLGRPPR